MSIKNNKGITLIALVITIIVLLILAGVTINMVLGDDGIIQNAQQAKQANEDASEKDAISIAKAEAAVATYGKQEAMKVEDLNTALGKTGKEEIEENTTVAKVTVDGVPIPIGFAYVEGTKKDTGLIIVDGSGNEFVWVPVDDFTKFAKAANTDVEGDYQGILYDVKSDGSIQEKTSYGQDTISFREPANLKCDNETNLPGFDANLFQDEYNKMAESVKKYKGFYVGRYETGGFNSTKVVSKAGENQESCTEVDWYEMYRMQKELYNKESDSVVSGMIYGSQWDAVMDWMSGVENPNAVDPDKNLYIEDSTEMGHYWYDADWNLITDAKAPIKTGSNSAYSVKNIFDLAGNYYEWTQEADGDFNRVSRGGRSYDSGSLSPVAVRRDYHPTNASDTYSSRLQLYIK